MWLYVLVGVGAIGILAGGLWAWKRLSAPLPEDDDPVGIRLGGMAKD